MSVLICSFSQGGYLEARAFEIFLRSLKCYINLKFVWNMNMPFFRNLSSVLGIRALLGLFSLLLNPLPFYLSFQRSSSLVPKNTSLSPSCVTWSHWVYILSYLIVHYRFLYKLPVSSFSPSPCHLIYEFLNTWNCILFIVLDTFMLLDFIMTEVVLSGRSSLIKWNEMKQYFSKMKSLQCL